MLSISKFLTFACALCLQLVLATEERPPSLAPPVNRSNPSHHQNGTTNSHAHIQFLKECPIKVVGNVTCAHLVVPERRDTAKTRNITVPVAILHAPSSAKKQPDPFLFLMGGQGQGYSVLSKLAVLPDLLGRDIITVEQRGTQLADPFFGCPNTTNLVDDVDRNYVSQPTNPDLADIQKCKAEISRHGIDRNGYDTEASADDLWDLKMLLDLDQWNVFGVSYGGRTAESFVRKYPSAARLLVLDSPQVTGIPFIFGYARLRKIGSFFSQCAGAQGCSQIGGARLKAAFESTVARLHRQPVEMLIAGRKQSLTARAYMHLITWVLYTREESAFRELPAAILAAQGRQYGHLLSLDERYADANTAPSPQPGDYPFALGDHIAQQTGVLCREEYPPLSWEGDHIRLPFLDSWSAEVQAVSEAEQIEQAEVCRRWNFTASSKPQLKLPPTNDVPTLVLHGDHDTIAPSEDGAVLQRVYLNSIILTFPWTGHGLVDRRQGCTLPLLRRFVDAPNEPLDLNCAAQIPEPFWLPFAPVTNKPETFQPVLLNVMRNQLQDFAFPGLAAHFVLGKSNISGTAATGYADAASGRNLTGYEPSRIASMTKTYTAATVLRLWEDGLLSLSDGIEQHLDNQTMGLLKSAGYDTKSISIQSLLQHNSGIPDYNTETYKALVMADPQHQWTRQEQITFAVSNEPKIDAPGSRFKYSDTGYVLLGEIIEVASGLSQATAYRKFLPLDSLGLQQTWFENLEPAPKDLSERAHQFYGKTDATWFNPSFDLYGGGGLISTVHDGVEFLRALFGQRVYKRCDTLQMMLSIPDTNVKHSQALRVGYGMGIESFALGDVVCWGHTGFWGTAFYHCDSEDVTVAVDRLQSQDPVADYNPLELLTTALRMNRLALRSARLF